MHAILAIARREQREGLAALRADQGSLGGRSMADARNPYEALPSEAFWRAAIAERNAFRISDLWKPTFKITPKQRFATAGSCFAQHIGRALVANGFGWHDGEPSPKSFPASVREKYSYGVFSFRTGNIYTAEALRQWVAWAFGDEQPPEEAWHHKGRVYDPFRPTIEPDGFESVEEMLKSRRVTLDAIRSTVESVDFFVFTMGLTEQWRNSKTGHVYAMCPGTVAGEFDLQHHAFENASFASIRTSMQSAMRRMREANKRLRFLLTVSPVPLTATASGRHVLVATTYSKSVLRAVAGNLIETRNDTDYFPSYEIITGVPFRGMFFEPNMRNVTPEGVAFVMRNFFAAIEGPGSTLRSAGGALTVAKAKRRPGAEDKSAEDVHCDEAMLEAFGA